MSLYLSHRLPLLAISLAGIISLQGCATKVNVKEIDVDLQAGTSVSGIPFRVPARFALDVYELTEDGKYSKLDTTTTADTLADTSRLYLLQVDSQPLSQGTVTFKLNTDATIETLKIVSSSKGQEALTELGAGIRSVSDAQATSKKADATKQTAGESPWPAAKIASSPRGRPRTTPNLRRWSSRRCRRPRPRCSAGLRSRRWK